MAKLEGKIVDAGGKVRKTTTGSRKTLDGGFVLWTGSWELFDLPPGSTRVELTAPGQGGEGGHVEDGEGAARESGGEKVGVHQWNANRHVS